MNRVKELRKDAGYTQERLARILGVTNKTVCHWEHGGDIKSSYLMQMVALFDCDLNTLLGFPSDDEIPGTL